MTVADGKGNSIHAGKPDVIKFGIKKNCKTGKNPERQLVTKFYNSTNLI